MRKWIFDSVDEEIAYWLDDIIDDFNYKCSNCGAKMRGGSESVKDARKAVKNESSNNI